MYGYIKGWERGEGRIKDGRERVEKDGDSATELGGDLELSKGGGGLFSIVIWLATPQATPIFIVLFSKRGGSSKFLRRTIDKPPARFHR